MIKDYFKWRFIQLVAAVVYMLCTAGLILTQNIMFGIALLIIVMIMLVTSAMEIYYAYQLAKGDEDSKRTLP